jgi:uncharacterized membrane protein
MGGSQPLVRGQTAMETWVKVLLWWLAFGASHTVFSSIPVRTWLRERVGPGPFQGIYSLVAFATFIPLNIAYWSNTHSGPWLWNLRPVAALHSAAIFLSFVGWVLVVAAILQPSPASLAPTTTKQAHGLSRITRHAMFSGLALWSLAHIVVNGFASDIAYFGGYLIFSIVGAMHQDARKRATEPSLAEFYATTSAVPFAAIAGGRNKFVAAELPVAGIVVGMIIAGSLYFFHDSLFG